MSLDQSHAFICKTESIIDFHQISMCLAFAVPWTESFLWRAITVTRRYAPFDWRWAEKKAWKLLNALLTFVEHAQIAIPATKLMEILNWKLKLFVYLERLSRPNRLCFLGKESDKNSKWKCSTFRFLLFFAISIILARQIFPLHAVSKNKFYE